MRLTGCNGVCTLSPRLRSSGWVRSQSGILLMSMAGLRSGELVSEGDRGIEVKGNGGGGGKYGAGGASAERKDRMAMVEAKADGRTIRLRRTDEKQ